MTAYYNENNKAAALWLRELIKEGLVAPGEVDERDIKDVLPADLKGFTQCHFFAGIGGWSLALRLAGWPDERPVWTGSCPCQPFSSTGRKAGFADERHLWPAWHHLILQHRPQFIFGEQVASPDGLAWLDVVHDDLEAARYTVGAADLCAAGIGAPHLRQRLWIVAAGPSVGDSARARWQGWSRSGARAPAWKGPGNAGRPLGMAHPSGGGRGERALQRARGGQLHSDGGQLPLWMADSGGEPGGLPGGPARGEVPEGGRSGEARGLGHPGEHGAREHGGELRGHEAQHEERPANRVHAPEPAGAARELADAPSGGCGERGHEALEGQGGHAHGNREPGGLADPAGEQCGAGRERAAGFEPGEEQRPPRHGSAAGPAGNEGRAPASAAGPVNGFWGNADWLFCRDGKWRPVEPGTFPLAHGLSLRVEPLRGYGNAIVPELAAEFIEAADEALSPCP